MNWSQADFTSMQGRLETRSILVLDGTGPRRRSNSEALRRLGHRVIEAETTQEALVLIDSQPIHLVVADLFAPTIGAPAFCRAIRKSNVNPFLPILLITRRGCLDEEVRAMEEGADGVLPYGVHPRALCAAVQSCLRRQAAFNLFDDTETVLFTLAQSVEERDPALGRHCERLTLIAASFGLELGLSRPEVLALERGAFLHDIGKVAIPDSVLFKPGPLNEEEWDIMKTHTERGERICRNVRSLAPVLPIIRSHHERWDGTGYPDGLKGEQIPLLARIVQFADIYDALTTVRPYKRALTGGEAISIMRDETKRGWRDPKLMDMFIDLAPSFDRFDDPELAQTSLHALASAIGPQRAPKPATTRQEARGFPPVGSLAMM